jgi:hypothetical protein
VRRLITRFDRIDANIDLLAEHPHVGLIGASESVIEDGNKCGPLVDCRSNLPAEQSNFPESTAVDGRILPFPTADICVLASSI